MLMAQAYVQMMLRAYEALLHHEINYRNLAEYKDITLLEKADKLVVTEGRNMYLLWMERIENAIAAAVRRKQFHLYTRHPKE